MAAAVACDGRAGVVDKECVCVGGAGCADIGGRRSPTAGRRDGGGKIGVKK